MKPLLLTILICLLSLTVLAQDATTGASPKIVTALGVIYVGMPKEYLTKAGYTELMQKDYRKETNKEWITFLNWSNPGSNLVTFYIVDGKIKGWEEE